MISKREGTLGPARVIARIAACLLCLSAAPLLAAPGEQGPYDSGLNVKKALAEAQARAASGGKLVMVVFGANWCTDCLVLHRSLENGATRDYALRNFEFVDVDVGKFDRNLDVARHLGVNLNKGIPAAVFLDGAGHPVAATNEGELESSRKYPPEQILKFLRGVVEQRKVEFPDHSGNN